MTVGERWVVIARMDDSIRLDGFDALRLSDVASIDLRFPRRSFYLRGLRQKRVTIPALPPLGLASVRQMLETAQRWFSLLTIDREGVNPGACEIGRILRFGNRTYTMKLMTPGADWDGKLEPYRYSDVTRVGLGGQYEETLASVAGLPDPKWR
jgi:hypothetical protein